MATTNYEAHKDLMVYAVKKSGGYETERYTYTGTDAIRFRRVEIKPTAALEQYDDHTGDLVKAGGVPMPIDCDVTLEGMIYGCSGAGSAADDDVLRVGIWNASATVPVVLSADSGCTTTRIMLQGSAGDYSGLESGVMVGVDIGSTSPVVEMRMVTSYSSLDPSIAVSPPLTVAPLTNAQIRTTRTYVIDTTCDENSTCIWKHGTHGWQKADGFVPASEKVSLNGGAPRVEWSGKARWYRQACSVSLASAVGASDTIIKVQRGDRITPGMKFGMYSGSTLRNTVYSKAKSGSDYIYVSGVAATCQTGSGVLSAIKPSQTVRGVPIPPARCKIHAELVSGTTTNIEMDTCELTIANGIDMHTRQAGDWQMNHGFSLSDDLSVEVTAAVLMEKARWSQWDQAGAGNQSGQAHREAPTIVQFGDKPGKIRAYYLPRFVPNFCEPETEGDGKVGTTFSGRAFGQRNAAIKSVVVADA